MEDAEVANLESKAMGKLSQNVCSTLPEWLSVMSEKQRCPWGYSFSANFGNSLGGRKRQNYKGNLGITLGMLQKKDQKKKRFKAILTKIDSISEDTGKLNRAYLVRKCYGQFHVKSQKRILGLHWTSLGSTGRILGVPLIKWQQPWESLGTSVLGTVRAPYSPYRIFSN